MMASRKLFLLLFITLPYISNAQWIRSNGPEGGHVYDVTADGSSLYAAVKHDIYRSSDQGQTWSSLGIKGYQYGINTVSASGSTILAGTENGIYRSIDNGNTWEAISNLLAVNDIAFSGSDLFAVASNGIYKSTNNGTTWTAGAKFDYGYSVFVDGKNIYAGGFFKGIYRSPDAGASWSLISLPNDGSVARDFVKLGTDLYVCTDIGGVYKSTDDGLNWVSVNNGMNGTPTAVALIAQNENLLVSTYNGVYRSSDKAANWTKVYSTINETIGWSFAAMGGSIFMATHQGVLMTSNSGSLWTFVNRGLVGTEVTSFLVKGTELYCGTRGNGVFRSTDGGSSWMPFGFTSINPNITALTLNGSTILAGTDGGAGLYQWAENAFSWTPLTTPFSQVKSLGVIVGKIYVGTFRHVYRSENSGSSWTDVVNGLKSDNSVKSFASLGSYIFAGAIGNNEGSFYRLHENGIEWVPMNTGLPNQVQVQHILVKNNTLYAVTFQGGIYQSTNNGENWTLVPNSNTLTGNYLTGTDQYFILATVTGTYFSSIDAPKWIQQDNGFPLPKMSIQTLYINGNKLLAGSQASGVWSIDISNMSSLVTDISEIRQQILIAYPNPATEKIYIHLQDQEDHHGTHIEIYDVNGHQQSANFAQEGNNIVADIDKFSSGVYIVKVTRHHTTSHIKFLKQ